MEKVYLNYRLEVLNKGGHSSVPSTDNAIYPPKASRDSASSVSR
jgi:hypothetical protein